MQRQKSRIVARGEKGPCQGIKNARDGGGGGGGQCFLAKRTRPQPLDNDPRSLGQSTQIKRSQYITSPWSCLDVVDASIVFVAPPLTPPSSPRRSATCSYKGWALGICSNPTSACASCMGSLTGLWIEVSSGPCGPSTSSMVVSWQPCWTTGDCATSRFGSTDPNHPAMRVHLGALQGLAGLVSPPKHVGVVKGLEDPGTR